MNKKQNKLQQLWMMIMMELLDYMNFNRWLIIVKLIDIK